MSVFFPMRKETTWPHWYKARTISGKAAGLGFYCDKCHLHFRYGAEAGVFHCGSLEKPPLITAVLPVRSLGPDSANSLPENLIPIGWDDYEEKNGNRSIFG